MSVFARRLGHRTAYVGAVAKDAAGRAIQSALEAEGVATDRLRMLAQGRTAYCFIGLERGERSFLNFDLGVSRFVPDEDDLAYLAGFHAVHVGQSSGLDDHLGSLARIARLSYDFSTRWDLARDDEILRRCFLAAFSGGGRSEKQIGDRISRALGAGAQWVLVTRGRQGAVLAGPGARFDVAAESCGVVDTLGAGDAFTAATLGALLDGVEPPEIFLSSAAAEAARACGHHGAVGYPTPLDIQP